MRRKIANILLIVIVLFTTIAIIGISYNKQRSVKKITVAKKEYQDKQYPVETYRNALLETAHAYYRKGEYMQYDNARTNYHASPEDATSQNYTYTVCSGFTYQTYYQTFGIRIPYDVGPIVTYTGKVQKNNPDDPTAIYYYRCRDIFDALAEDADFNTVKQAILETQNCVVNLNNYIRKTVNDQTPTNKEISDFGEISYDELEPGDLVSHGRLDKEQFFTDKNFNSFLNDETLNTPKKKADALKNAYSSILNSQTGHTMIVDSIDNDGIHLIDSTGGGNIQILDNENYNEYNIDISEINNEADLDLIRPREYYEPTGTIKNNKKVNVYLNNQSNKNESTNENDKKTYIASLALTKIITPDLTYPDRLDVTQRKALNLTPAAETRLEYPDIDIDKTYKINNKATENQVVSLNDEIEYTIKIKNNSNESYGEITIKEEIPKYATIGDIISTSITSSNSTVGGVAIADLSNNYIKTENNTNIIEYTVPNVPVGETYSFTYSVTVNNNEANIGKYIESKGTTGNINNRTINLQIGQNLSSNSKQEIIDAYNNLKNTENSNGLNFIRKVYESANLQNISTDLGLLYNNGTALTASQLVNIGERIESSYPSGNYYTYVINEAAEAMLLYNYYGVRMTSSSSDADANRSNHVIYRSRNWSRYPGEEGKNTDADYKMRARNLEPANLDVGDIIYYNDRVYLYIGNNTLVGRNGGKIEEYSDTTTLTPTIFLRNAIADNYIVLRPSLMKRYTLTVKHLITGTSTAFDTEKTKEVSAGKNYNTSISSKANPASYYDITIPDNANGVMTEDTVVTYYYKLKTGKVIVKHLDKDGNNLAESTETTYNYGENYETSPLASLKENYIVRTPAENTGLVNKDEIEVIYYYYPKEDQKVEFESEIEGDEIVKEVKDTYNYKIRVTAKYTDYVDKSTIKIIYNLPYEINEETSSLDGGVYNANNKTITWEEEIDVDSYEEDTYNFEKNITVQYRNIDYEQGSMLSTLRLESDDDIYMDSSMMHQTEFEIPAKIIVKYLDEDGNELMESEEINDLVGNIIELKDKEIPGYTIISSPTASKYTVEEQTLVYRYQRTKKEEVVENIPNTKLNKTVQAILFSLSGIVLILAGLMIFAKQKTIKN